MKGLIERLVANPKTSTAGVLTALVTVLGVLQQQGVAWGKTGTGTVVSVCGAVASALLGVLAKD